MLHHHFGKTFFTAATFKGFSDVSFQKSKKVGSMIWSVWVYFASLENGRPNRYCLWEENIAFHM